MDNIRTPKPLTGRTVLVALLAFFGVVISVNLIMMKFAIETLPGTEVDSAYSASLRFTSEVAAAQEQDRRGWNVGAHLERKADGTTFLTLDARDRAGFPLSSIEFTARLARPTDKRADQAVSLVEKRPGIFRGELSNIEPGQWDLVVEGKNTKERVYLSTNRIILR